MKCDRSQLAPEQTYERKNTTTYSWDEIFAAKQNLDLKELGFDFDSYTSIIEGMIGLESQDLQVFDKYTTFCVNWYYESIYKCDPSSPVLNFFECIILFKRLEIVTDPKSRWFVYNTPAYRRLHEYVLTHM